MDTIEIWKPILGYEGKYAVSNHGRVKSLNYRHTGKDRLLSLLRDGHGYHQVVLYIEGQRNRVLVHRIVAEAFIPNTDNKPHIDHINTNRLDNRPENLRWCTRQENSNNPLTCAHHSKRTLQFDTNGTLIKEWASAREASACLGISVSAICSCRKGRSMTSGGYVWR